MKEQTKERVSLHILKRERGHDLVHDWVTNPASTKHHINTITLCPLRVLSARVSQNLPTLLSSPLSYTSSTESTHQFSIAKGYSQIQQQ